MKLKRLKIKKFKNLKDIEINFSSNYSIFIGENGSGKTNILEALSLIFDDLYKATKNFTSEYELEYEIKGKIILIVYENSSLNINIDSLPSSQQQLKENLPDHIFLIYTGNDKKLEEIYSRIKDDYVKKNLNLKKDTENPISLRNMINLNENYSDILFINYLKNVQNRDQVANIIEIKLQETKTWGKNSPKTKQEIFDKAKGETKKILELLRGDISEELEPNIIYNSEEGTIVITNPEVNENNNFLKDSRIINFKNLELLLLSDIIGSINIETRKNLKFYDFSEGQKQKYINHSLFYIEPDKENLILLDEPDSHLHPKWIREFSVDIGTNVSSTNTHVIYVTHSPLVLGTTTSENIHILKSGKNVICNDETFYNDINTILEEIMEVQKYSTVVSSLENEILSSLVKCDLDYAELKIKELIRHLTDQGVKNPEDHELVLELSGMLKRMELINEFTE